MRNRHLLYMALHGLLLPPACGGGGGGPHTIVVPTTAAFDGFVGKVGNSDSDNTVIFVGDYLANPARGLVGFSLAGVPSGATMSKTVTWRGTCVHCYYPGCRTQPEGCVRVRNAMRTA